MKDKKKWVIGLLCTLVCIMAVGYAVLAQQLNINGTASIDSTWKVEITNIGESEVVGKAVSKVTPSYTSTTANFSVGLTQPGDSITYDVEISNLGTLDAKVDSINVVTDENDAIKYATTGIANGDKLAAGEKTTLTIKVEYDSSVTSQPEVTTKDITVTINYVQDLDEETTATYQTYSIGDQITFAGSNWYVINNSTSDEDYVTLLKETILTNDELGDYAINDTSSVMSYYWSDTCYWGDSYGYTGYATSGCAGHNDYNGSKVKEMLENQYLPTLGADDLKEVDGYKVRLINTNDLLNLGWNEFQSTATEEGNEDVPIWLYSGFGASHYMTMSAVPETDDSRYGIDSIAIIRTDNVAISTSVRPVINLLKSSIE